MSGFARGSRHGDGPRQLQCAAGYCHGQLPHAALFQTRQSSLAWPGTDVNGRWVSCTPESAPAMTAAGFYFARRIQKETGIPDRAARCQLCGSRIELWMPVSAFESEPSLTNMLQEVTNMLQELKKPADTYRASAYAVLDAMEKWIPEARRHWPRLATRFPRAPQLPGRATRHRDLSFDDI